MKLFYIIAIVVGLFLYPVETTQIEDLRPIRVLMVSNDNGDVVLDGGDGMVGKGETWEAAMDGLERSASGRPFFGTTSAVVLEDGSLLEGLLQETRLRPAAGVYYGAGTAEELCDFLEDQNSEMTIQILKSRELSGGYVSVPRILETEGGFELAP